MKNLLLLAALTAATAGTARAQTTSAKQPAAAMSASAATSEAAAPAPLYAKQTKTPQERAASKVRTMTRDMGISAEQGEKLLPILVAQNTTLDALRDQANATGKSKEISTAMKTANQEADDKMKAVLTPAQFDAFIKDREEKKAARQAGAK